MPFTPGSAATVSISGTPIAAYLTSAGFSTDRDAITLNLLGGNAKAKIVQSPTTSGTLEGAYEPTVSAIFQPYFEDPNPTALAMVYVPQGTGDTYTGNAHFTNWSTDTPGDDAATFSVDYEIDGDWVLT
jgi:hypothetical protein